jgi:uncharacterized membrane protein
MLSAIPYWIHLLAATLWVGGQLMLFLAVMPAARAIDPPTARGPLVRAVTRRFGYLGWGALLLLILTGIGNVFERDDFYQPTGVFEYDYRYAWLLTAKLALVVIVVLLTAWHTFILGPRMLTMQEWGPAGRTSADTEARLRRLRRLSMILTAITLLLSLVILYLVTLMQDAEFAFKEI